MKFIENLKNLDENQRNKTMKIALVAEVVLIALFVGIIIVRHNFLGKDDAAEVAKVEATQEPVSVSDSYDSMTSIYTNILVGHTFKAGKNTFAFKEDGSYSGYFNADNKKISEAKYEVSYSDAGPVINITYGDSIKTYAISFSDDYNVVLAADDQKFELVEK